MAHEVIIDIETRFKDNATKEAKAAAKSFEGIEKAAEGAQREVDELGKAKVKPKVDADTSRAAKKLGDIDKKLNKLGRSKTDAKLSVMDKATALIDKVTSKAKAFANKTYSGVVKIRDSNALSTLNKMSDGLKGLTKKAWSVAVKIKDTFTAPLTKLKNMLFNVKTLIAGIASAWAATKLIMNPINVADAYSSAKISFSTLLGESQGQQMMDDLDQFAKATPFNTTNVIGNAQKMLAMGWDAENIIDDMETIGNAAAATGKLDVGLESIVRALSQIKTKGKLSTEELNQLAEAGISAKAMLAENLGYGTGDSGIAAMTEDLEKGAIASDVAIQALLAGMQKYDGMMDSMANETVEGLWSQMQDAFSINIVRKWGQGLQDGAKRGFGSIVSLLDEAEEGLAEFGETLYEVGKTISNWTADKLENTIKRITDITGSFEFKNANLKEKISMLWNGVIVDPLKEWWEGGGRDKTAETAGEIGSWMGKTITSGLLAIFGMTDILDDETASKLGESGGMSIAQSFAKGFKDNFDGSAITDAFVDAIGNVWGALPTWAKILLGGYGIGKAAGGIANFAGGITKFIGSAGAIEAGNVMAGGSGLLGVIGRTGVYGVAGSGILGGLSKFGYGASAKTAALLGSTKGGAALLGVGGGTAALAGAGALAAGASVVKGGIDLYRGYTTDDKVEAKASKASGWTTLGGVGAGAAIGTAILPGVGTLIGAGIGGIAGWIGGNAWADEIRKTDDAINDVTAATEELETEEEKLAEKAKRVYQNMKEHFGDIKLSMSEIQAIAKQIVWGDDLGKYEQFTMATKTAEASLQSLKSAAEDTNRWMWKAALGVSFDADDQESIIASFDEYIAGAQSYVENKHYEFTAAVSLLVDTESEVGKSIMDTGNAFYGQYQADLEAAGKELGDLLTNAVADGFINAEEHNAIVAAQKKIAEITQKISDAETTAELELIKVKFGDGRMDEGSFDNFMEQMETTLSERVAANDEAFTASISTLKLELAEGAITQEEYDKQLQALTEGYTGKVDEIKAKVMHVELDIIADAYAEDDVTKEKLQTALENSLKDGVDPITWTTEDARKYLGIDDLKESSAGALAKMLGDVADQLELVTVDGKLLLDLGIETRGTTQEEVEEKVNDNLPETVEATVGVDITGEKNIQNTIDVLVEDFGIPEEQADTVALLLTGDKEILSKIDTSQLAEELGVPEDVAETIITKLTGSKSIEERVNVLGTDLVDSTEVWQTITVNLKAKVGQVADKIKAWFGGGSDDDDGSGYRGGIFGGTSAMEGFALGGRPDDGMLDGSIRYIRVNEEAPEMIIPLSSQRRGRALKLWAEAGNIMGVPGFARGGIIGGNSQDEGIRFNTYGSSQSAGGRTVQVDVGGITLEINVSGSDRESIVEAIKAQAGELADYMVGIIADALEDQFENTPVRGGVA